MTSDDYESAHYWVCWAGFKKGVPTAPGDTVCGINTRRFDNEFEARMFAAAHDLRVTKLRKPQIQSLLHDVAKW
jgi:hypothetical protein